MANITFSEASGLTDSIYGKSQAPIRLFIEKQAEAYEQQSMLPLLFEIGPGKGWAEKLSAMTAMDGFQPVGENGAYPVDGQQLSYEKTLTYMVWKDSFALTREIIDDATIMDLKKKPAGFTAAYYRTRERFGAALYGAAIQGLETATFRGVDFDVTAADELPLFSAEHPSKIYGTNYTQSNLFSDAFSNDALGAMETAMQDFRGDNRELLAVAPDTIVIPNDYALKNAVFAAIGADKDPATSNNAFNYNFGRWNVVVWPYLNEFITSGTSPWILLDSKYNQERSGAPWRDRKELEVKSSIDENTDANVWRGYSRFGATFNDWRFCAVGGVTGGSTLIA